MKKVEKHCGVTEAFLDDGFLGHGSKRLLILCFSMYLEEFRIRGGFQRLHEDLFMGQWWMLCQVLFAISLVACKPQVKIPHHTQEYDD